MSFRVVKKRGSKSDFFFILYFFQVDKDRVYSFSSDLILAAGLVMRMASCAARSIRAFLFLEATPCAISAQYTLFCIISTSSSFMLWMRTFLKPEGMACRVILLEP